MKETSENTRIVDGSVDAKSLRAAMWVERGDESCAQSAQQAEMEHEF